MEYIETKLRVSWKANLERWPQNWSIHGVRGKNKDEGSTMDHGVDYEWVDGGCTMLGNTWWGYLNITSVIKDNKNTVWSYLNVECEKST